MLFFLMYLYVIRNNKLHHFMRFYCMQVCAWQKCMSIADHTGNNMLSLLCHARSSCSPVWLTLMWTRSRQCQAADRSECLT